jgi:hypothetical protein
MLMQVLTHFRGVITFPAVSPEPTSFSSVFELGGRKGIGKGMRHGGRRLRDGSSAPERFARVEVCRFAYPGGQEGMEVTAFFGGEMAFFVRCCPETAQG